MNIASPPSLKRHRTGSLLSLALFIILVIVITYPVAARLSDFSVLSRYADTMLQAWTLEWDVHTLLSGPGGVSNFWNANIFYPYPRTLAFSEHLLGLALVLMPATLLGGAPLVSANLGILFTSILSGWGTYLLVMWLTRNRWAGIIAGIFFAISPFRMGHLVHLNLLSTHWLPFIFLVTARLIKHNKNKDLVLLIISVNLQFLSAINYATIIAVGLLFWFGFHLVTYRHRIRLSLLIRLAVFGVVTLVLNWPILQIYQQVSEQMGVVRSLGDARILANSIGHYLKPMANSLLYARWLNLPTLFDSAFPGIVVLLLAITGIILIFHTRTNRYLMGVSITLLIIILIGFTLSFGANEQAFGRGLAPVVAPLLPYPYLYDLLPLLKGFRVTARFALLVTFGLAILAGLGFAELGRHFWPKNGQRAVVTTIIGALIFVEHVPAPVPGETVIFSSEVYDWLAARPMGTVVIELPYYLHTDHSELNRVYQSARHWQRLVNGNSGFEPTWLVELGRVLDGFPDSRSFDAIRQLGVGYVVLHRQEYQPQDWENILALLPGYLPSVEAIHTVGEDLILQLRAPTCNVDRSQIYVNAQNFPELSITNYSAATFFADPHQVSSVTTNARDYQFLEPLLTLPGQTQTFEVPVDRQTVSADWQVQLANLADTLTPAAASAQPTVAVTFSAGEFQPIQLPFANGTVLEAMAIGPAPQPCGQIALALKWSQGFDYGEAVRVELIDRFKRLVISSDSQPRREADSFVSTHILPLAETVPPGQYQLQVQLLATDGTDIKPLGPDGAPVNVPVSLPIVIRPGLAEGVNVASQAEISHFANGVKLLGIEGLTLNAKAGDWMRFVLTWQSEGVLSSDYTVFTQLLGPDGQVWGQHDNPPKGGWYPTSLWEAEEVVTDDYAVRFDPAAPLGEYHLIVGLYNPATGKRVRIATGRGAGNDFVDMATIMVTNP